MAWLQNLAGKAEDLLNKIDKNAATVLNETNSATPLTQQIDGKESNVIDPPGENSRTQTPTNFEIISEKHGTESVNQESEHSETEDIGIIFSPSPNKNSSTPTEEDFKIFERSLKNEPTFSSKASSYEDQIRYEEQINKLEAENEVLSKQILNLQHQHSMLQNDYGNLNGELDIAKQSAQQAQDQMEQYKIRAQRILQEKEKLINVKSDYNDDDEDSGVQNQILTNYNEELKKELQFQQERNLELSNKISNLNRELMMLQQQLVSVQSNSQQSNKSLHETLMSERKFRANFEEELHIKTKEIQSLRIQMSTQQTEMYTKDMEIVRLKQLMKDQKMRRSSDDLELRLNSLTHTLMLKQSTLETMTSERNALKIQLEKLEGSYNLLLNQKEHSFVKISTETDESNLVPRLMQLSPLDAGVTRRVKHAYSTLDTISIRTGAFLRRYPLARIFVFCYMILLHIWVLIILFTYVPTGR